MVLARITLYLLIPCIFYFYSSSTEPVESVVTETASKAELSNVRAMLNPERLQTVIEPKETTSTYTVKSGDTLSSIWSHFEGEHVDAIAIAKSLKDAEISPNYFLKVGANLNVTTDTENNISSLSQDFPEGKKVKVYFDHESNSYLVEKIDPEVSIAEETKAAVIEGSLAATAERMNLHYNIVDELVDIFSHQIEFNRDIHPGDSFSVIYNQRSLDSGETLTPGDVLAASIHSQGKMYIAVMKKDDEGNKHYFDENAKPIGNYFLRYPLKFTRISSVFSKSRFHPVLKIRRPHNGVDFAAPTGTPVRSVASGKIEAAAYSRTNGNWVKIRHDDRYQTAYLHLSKIAKGIKKGTKVTRGQLIGYVGSTGLSSGPHLHYSFYDKGKYVDPMKIKLPTMTDKKTKIDPELFKVLVARLEDSLTSVKGNA